MKLNGNALGLSLGLVWGGTIFLATILLLIKARLGIHYQAGDPIGPTLLTLGQFYMGYSMSFFGSIVGFIYGFINAYLVGVIIAVALLPPLASFGLLLGAGFFTSALGSLLLLITNLICVNLAGVITFLAQGIKPTSWWEKAKRATRRAILFWTLLLIALITVIIISQRSVVIS